MATAQKSNKQTAFINEKNTPRRERQIENRMRYRLNKRRNLWLRSIAVAKDPRKIEVLKAKIEAIDFALSTLSEV